MRFNTYCKLAGPLMFLLAGGCRKQRLDVPGTELIVQGMGDAGSYGIFDAAIVRDPDDERFWLSYSAAEPSSASIFGIWQGSISLRLAYSEDFGESWHDIGQTSGAEDVNVALSGPVTQAGTWISEVSALVYEPQADVAERWKLLWNHFLYLNGQARHELGWLGAKVAPTAAGLINASEIKLFGHSYWDKKIKNIESNIHSPLPGEPLIPLDQAIDPALGECIFFEPSWMATDLALYLALVCVDRNRTEDASIVLLKCASPCRIDDVNGWQYLGKPLSGKDAVRIGYNRGFTAPQLAKQGSTFFLIVTPMSERPFEGYFNGCRAYRFSDLDQALLERDDNIPREVMQINGVQNSFNGGCTYHEEATKAGVIFNQLSQDDLERFHLYKSVMALPSE